MAYVLVQDGVVVQKQPDPADGFIEAPESVVCGFLYADGEFTQPEPPPAPLPTLEPWRFRAMLKLSGKESDLTAFLDALPEPQQTIAKAKMEYTLIFERDNDLVLSAQQALGLTDAELDALWTQAASL